MIDVRRFKRCPGACGRSCQGKCKTEVVEICGHTYANKTLRRYDTTNYADPVKATTLSALADYIVNCREEFTEGRRMIIHVVSPTKVRLMSALDGERKREVLLETEAQVSGFHFDQWYDQESFMISLQANFAKQRIWMQCSCLPEILKERMNRPIPMTVVLRWQL